MKSLVGGITVLQCHGSFFVNLYEGVAVVEAEGPGGPAGSTPAGTRGERARISSSGEHGTHGKTHFKVSVFSKGIQRQGFCSSLFSLPKATRDDTKKNIGPCFMNSPNRIA